MMEQNNALFKENQPVDMSEEEKIIIHEEADDILISEEVSSDQAEDFINTIEEMGVEKPDPAIFAMALQQTGIMPADAVYVGDTEADVVGAIAARIHPIYIARPNNRTDSDALDFQVTYPNNDLSENRIWKNEVTVISSLPEVLDIAMR